MEIILRISRTASLVVMAAHTLMAATPMEDPCPSSSSAAGPAPDHSAWTAILKDVVVPNGTVGDVRTAVIDYKKLRAEKPSRLRAYMLSLCSVNVSSLSTLEQIALWTNAYNAMMTSMIVHYNPGKTVKEISGVVSSGQVWKEVLATVGGERVSLDIIEHVKVRGSGLAHSAGIAGRIHTAFVCASASCPDIQTEAFEASTLTDQVTAATRSWLLNPTKNPGPQGGALRVSKIFQWYGQDFLQESGSIHNFARTYAGWTATEVPDSAPLGYLPYNWDLNARNASGKSISRASSPCRPLLASSIFAAVSLGALSALSSA